MNSSWSPYVDLDRAAAAAKRFVAQPGAETALHLTVPTEGCLVVAHSAEISPSGQCRRHPSRMAPARPEADRLGEVVVYQVDGPKWFFSGDASRLERLAQAVEVLLITSSDVAE